MSEQHGQKKKRILALDTSTSSMAIAFLHNEQLTAQIELQTVRNHSLKLVPAIQSIMQGQGGKGEDVDLLAVGIGPGSYTGVRVAVTAAKTMAWAWNKPVVGVSSLHALALSCLEKTCKCDYLDQDIVVGYDWVYPLIDARRGQVYTARFIVRQDTSYAELNTGVNIGVGGSNSSFHNNWLGQRLEVDGIRLFSQVAKEVNIVLEQQLSRAKLEEIPGRVWFVGEIEPHLASIDQLQQQFGKRIQALSCVMKARWIGHIGLASALYGQVGETHRLEPNYTQLTEAEAKLLAKEQVATKNSIQY